MKLYDKHFSFMDVNAKKRTKTKTVHAKCSIGTAS